MMAGEHVPAEAGPVRVSSIVLCFNAARHIKRCVESLLKDPSAAHDEVWLVDNGSTDDSAEILTFLQHRFPGRVHIISLDRNYGTTASRNRGLRAARGRYIAIVDADAELPSGSMDRLIARVEGEPRAGIVAPRLTYPDGRFQLSVDLFPAIPRKLHRILRLRALEASAPQHSGLHEVDYAISACWLLKRETVEAVGLFDEAIFYSPEDVDYCIRVWAAGYRVLYDPAITAIHHAQELSRSLIPKRIAFSHLSGLAYLYRKHRFWLRRAALYHRIGRFDAKTS